MNVRSVVPRLALVAGWIWAIVAGGGGLLLLVRLGPWPPTNGWFALLSGVSACPATAWLFKRFHVELSGRAQLIAAATFFALGRIALLLEHR
ncbi:MAG: hypothetical protein WAK19_05155 [Candidatus Cybelea sp.]